MLTHKEQTQYSDKIFLLLRGELPDWDRGFLESVNKQLGRISEKQLKILHKISDRYLVSVKAKIDVQGRKF